MQTAPFVELLAVPSALAKNPLFDIIVEEKITIQNYCNALIAKILEIASENDPVVSESLRASISLNGLPLLESIITAVTNTDIPAKTTHPTVGASVNKTIIAPTTITNVNQKS